MNITVIQKRKGIAPAAPSGIRSSNPYTNRYGAWGISQEVHSQDNSVDVLLDVGALIQYVPVASAEWVLAGDKYTSGERNLPPAGSRVFVMMPSGNLDNCFVLCSGFVPTDAGQKSAFLGDELEKIRLRVFPGNWKEEYQYATGTYEIISPDEKTSLKIDYGTEDEAKDPPDAHLKLFEKITLDVKSGDSVNMKIFDTELTIKEGEVSIKPKKMTVEVDGDVTIQTNGEAAFKATGSGLVEIGNAVETLGAFLDEILSALKQLYTQGSPVYHTAGGWAASFITPLAEKLKKIFK